MSGDFLGFCLASGSFCKLILETGWFPEAMNQIEANRAAYSAMMAMPPQGMHSVKLEAPYPFFDAIVLGSVFGILLYEIAISLAFAFKRFYLLGHCLLILFGLSLVLIRPEVEFIAAMACLGILSTDSQQRRLRIAYTVLVIGCSLLLLWVWNAKHVVIA